MLINVVTFKKIQNLQFNRILAKKLKFSEWDQSYRNQLQPRLDLGVKTVYRWGCSSHPNILKTSKAFLCITGVAKMEGEVKNRRKLQKFA